MQALDLLVVVTGHLQKPFMNPILLGRLASTLTILLRKLVENQDTLKVSDPEKYGFNAKDMLRKVITTCLHMYETATGDVFCAALAGPFVGEVSVAVLDRATKILTKYRVLGGDFQGRGVELWTAMVAKVKDEVTSQEEDEEMLGEVPEEFECQLLFTIMTDPVMLPDNGQSSYLSFLCLFFLSSIFYLLSSIFYLLSFIF